MGAPQKAVEHALLKLDPDKAPPDLRDFSILQLLEAKKKSMQLVEVTAFI